MQTYSSEPLTVLGQMMVNVRYNGYVGNHFLLVMKDKGSNLIERDWYRVIRIDWANIKELAVEKWLYEYTKLPFGVASVPALF